MPMDIIARGMSGSALSSIKGIEVGGAPYIQAGTWYVWDKASSSYINSGIDAKGNGISKIEKVSTIDNIDTYRITFDDSTTFDYQVYNGIDGTINGKTNVALVAGDNIDIIENDTEIIISTSATGGGIPEAPEDGKQYARQDGAWSVVVGGEAKNAVLYTEQTLSDVEKAQARANIGITTTKSGESVVFDNDSVIDSKVIITHTRNTKNVLVGVYNNIEQLVIPTEIQILSENQVVIDLTDILIEGEWRVVIQGGDSIAGGSTGGGAVDSVNGKTGVVILSADDVGALPDTTFIPTQTSDLVNDSNFATTDDIPETLPNPFSLRFTGGTTQVYNGSSEVVVDISNTLTAGDNIDITDDVISATIPQSTEANLGGIKAKARTTETNEVVIDPVTGKAYTTASSGEYTLTVATNTILGGVKGLAKTTETTEVVIDDDGFMFVDVPEYILPTATNSIKGGIVVGDNLNINEDVLSVDTTTIATKLELSGKADLVDGKIPSAQLPSFVDDVVEVDNFASLPTTGESGKVYVALDTNLTYRWGGTEYVAIGNDLALGETPETAYRGDRGKIAYDFTLRRDNPSEVTATQVGLGNVDNTSDLDKPISTATQTALDLKQDILTAGNGVDITDNVVSIETEIITLQSKLVDGVEIVDITPISLTTDKISKFVVSDYDINFTGSTNILSNNVVVGIIDIVSTIAIQRDMTSKITIGFENLIGDTVILSDLDNVAIALGEVDNTTSFSLSQIDRGVIAGHNGVGENGATFLPTGTVDGNQITFSWTNDKGLDNPDPVTLTAPNGNNATINGVNTLSLIGGNNIEIAQDGSELTISANPLPDIKIDTQTIIPVDNAIALPTKTMTITFDDGTTQTWKLVGIDG